LSDIHGPIVLGLAGGVLGALFIEVQTRCGRLRKQYVNTNLKRIAEAAFFGCFTITMFTIAVAGLNACEKIPNYRKVPESINDEIGDIILVDEKIEGLNTWTCESDVTYSK